MHVQKKIRAAILDLGKKSKKPLFSAVSQPTDHLEGWLYWWKVMASSHIGEKILSWHLVLHYFRYKMADEVCQYLRGSSSAHRQVGPHVLYIKMTGWVTQCLLLEGQKGTGHAKEMPNQTEGWITTNMYGLELNGKNHDISEISRHKSQNWPTDGHRP